MRKWSYTGRLDYRQPGQVGFRWPLVSSSRYLGAPAEARMRYKQTGRRPSRPIQESKITNFRGRRQKRVLGVLRCPRGG